MKFMIDMKVENSLRKYKEGICLFNNTGYVGPVYT